MFIKTDFGKIWTSCSEFRTSSQTFPIITLLLFTGFCMLMRLECWMINRCYHRVTVRLVLSVNWRSTWMHWRKGTNFCLAKKQNRDERSTDTSVELQQENWTLKGQNTEYQFGLVQIRIQSLITRDRKNPCYSPHTLFPSYHITLLSPFP